MNLTIYLESLSRRMSKELRHNPDAISILGMEPDGGRVDFWKFYDFLKQKYKSITPSDITNIVRKDDKGRFSIECYKKDLILDYFEILKEVRLHKPGLKENKVLNELRDIFEIKIRANQGHSISEVLPDLKITTNLPTYLYHGTSEENIDSILSKGLFPGKRHHVHLTDSMSLAKKRGEAIVMVDTQKMIEDGWNFLISKNGVHFTEKGNKKIIPIKYLKKL